MEDEGAVLVWKTFGLSFSFFYLQGDIPSLGPNLLHIFLHHRPFRSRLFTVVSIPCSWTAHACSLETVAALLNLSTVSDRDTSTTIAREWPLHPVVVEEGLALIQVHLYEPGGTPHALVLVVVQNLPCNPVVDRLAVVPGQVQQFLVWHIKRDIPERYLGRPRV